MKYYLVRTISKATDINLSFAGQTLICFYGKAQKCLSRDGDHAELNHCAKMLYPREIEEYGYTRKQEALRSWVYKNPENNENWKTAVSIEEFDIDDPFEDIAWLTTSY